MALGYQLLIYID